MMMRFLVLFAASTLFYGTTALSRSRRAAYELPDAAELIVGSIQKSFTCPEGKYGYFADVANECKIFHICNPITYPDGRTETQQYSFFCGNQTVFNQLSLTCAFPEEAIPCQNAPDFFYVNDNIGNPEVPFLTDNDIEKAAPLIPGFQSLDQESAPAPRSAALVAAPPAQAAASSQSSAPATTTSVDSAPASAAPSSPTPAPSSAAPAPASAAAAPAAPAAESSNYVGYYARRLKK